MKLLKRIQMFFLMAVLLVATLLQTGCVYRGYKGDKPELYSVAWANLIATDGCWSDGCERLGDSVVYVLEEDSQGRVLFTYFEGSGALMNLLIMQKKADGKAYYYPEDCYVSFVVSNEEYAGWRCNAPSEEEMKEIIATDFTQEGIDALKAANDWGQPINESKCDTTSIVKKKPNGRYKSTSTKFQTILENYYEYNNIELHPKNVSLLKYSRFIMKDAYGREMYYVISSIYEYTDKTQSMYYYPYLVVIQKDKSYDVSTMVLVEDISNPQAMVKQIKQVNNWNQPIV